MEKAGRPGEEAAQLTTCRLHLFIWRLIIAEEGKKVLEPICPSHPDAPVEIESANVGKDIVVTCTAGKKLHLVNMCPKEAFEEERNDAGRVLTRFDPEGT